MSDRLKKRKADLINISWLLVMLGGLYVACKYLVPLFFPFLFGFAIALICKPISIFLRKKFRLREKICGAITLFLVYLFLFLLMWFLGGKLLYLMQNFAVHAQEYYSGYIAPVLNKMEEGATKGAQMASVSWAPQISDVFSGFSSGLQTAIAQLSSNALSFVAGIGMQIPKFLVNSLFAIMASIFISIDYSAVSLGIIKLFPKKRQKTILEAKQLFIETVGKYLRAYGILMVLTFIELSAGLCLLRVENPFAIAAATALCDAMPVLGTGVILIPWAALELVLGKFPLAVGILTIYCIVGVVRSFLEPRILGKQLGLHPLVTLVAVYLGAHMFGVLGMVFFPMLVQIIVQLKRAEKEKLT